MGVSDQCQRGEEEEKEGSWRIRGARGREVPAGQVSELSAEDVTISHHEEMEKVNSPGYLKLSCKEDVHKMNP